MPKFLDAPSWYTSQGNITYGVGINNPSGYGQGMVLCTGAYGVEAINIVPHGTAGAVLCENGAGLEPYWTLKNLYYVNAQLRANCSFNNPSSSSDFPMYCSQMSVTFYSKTNVTQTGSSTSEKCDNFMKALYNSTTSGGNFFIFSDSQFNDMGLNQQGGMFTGAAQIVMSAATGSNFIIKAVSVQTLPASTTHPPRIVYVYPNEIISLGSIKIV